MSLAKIGNKIFDKEVKLSKEEVELSLISDLQKEINKGVAIGDRLRKQLDKMQKENDELQELKLKAEKKEEELDSTVDIGKSMANVVRAMYTRASKNYEKLINAASDLGIEYPKNIDTNMKKLEKQVEFSKNIGKQFR